MTSHDILYQPKMNKFGGYYINGKAFSMDKRAEIIQQFQEGVNVVQIARNLQISHGVVSKILQHYRLTHSIAPKSRSSPYARKPALTEAISNDQQLFDGEVPFQPRVYFAKEQTAVLAEYFEISPIPTMELKEEISKKTNLTPKQITTWFSNRRTRVRKSLKAAQENDAQKLDTVLQKLAIGASASDTSSILQNHGNSSSISPSTGSEAACESTSPLNLPVSSSMSTPPESFSPMSIPPFPLMPFLSMNEIMDSNTVLQFQRLAFHYQLMTVLGLLQNDK